MRKNEELEKLFDHERMLFHQMDRRHFLSASGKIAGLALGLVIAHSVQPGKKVEASPRFREYPFTLGVASGDPQPDGFVIWTRLAPDPLNGGGMPAHDVPVRWEVASDPHFRRVVKHGVAFARFELAHSVHVEVEGLQPEREYFYRFQAGPEVSPVGRSKTTPLAGRMVSSLSFAFASCQQYEHGYYTAYRHMANEDLDFVFHLGDYIYEYGPNEYVSPTGNVRTHHGPEILTLEDYRNRHAQYKSDGDLQAAHAAFPWIVTWDDHEVENNYADEIPENGQSREAFVRRRAAAYQAYYEHMPLRRSSLPDGPDMQLYREFVYGKLARFLVLDTRQYRDNQANGDGIKPPSKESTDPGRTLLGDEQEQWLMERLKNSRTMWNVLVQQVFFSQLDFSPGPGKLLNMDAWDGYSASRNRLVDFMKQLNKGNTVVLTGDVHANWAAEIKADFDDPQSAVVGAEFIGTSITSGGNGSDRREDTNLLLKENPHIKFFNDYRGYVRCTITPEVWRTDYRVVPYVTRPGAPIHTRASFEVLNGRPHLRKMSDQALPAGLQKSREVEADRIRAQEQAAEKQLKQNLIR